MPEIIKPLVQRYKNKNWKPFLGETLPENAIKFFETQEAFRSGYGRWLIGSVYFTGSDKPEEATQWIMVMDDGGYYKCFAEYSFWHISKGGNLVMQCSWNWSHLLKNLRSFLNTGSTVRDPLAQT